MKYIHLGVFENGNTGKIANDNEFIINYIGQIKVKNGFRDTLFSDKPISSHIYSYARCNPSQDYGGIS